MTLRELNMRDANISMGNGNDEDNVAFCHRITIFLLVLMKETSAVRADAQKNSCRVKQDGYMLQGMKRETTPLEVIESYLDNNEADKAIQGINEMLSSTDFTDEDETKSIYYYYLGLAYAQKMTEQLRC